MAAKTNYPCKHRICNPHQVGGIETSVLDNGLGRGSRIAWVSTGTGLRYKLLIDRGLDILDAFYNEHSLAWLAYGGAQRSQPHANYGLEWLHTWGGGLITTCGLVNVGMPYIVSENEQYGLHGRYSNIPAEVESVIQPDPANGKLDFSITAVIHQAKMFGPSLELRRTVSGRIGEPEIVLEDTVTNRGSAPAPHMLLYHVNFGWPLIDKGTRILYRGKATSVGRPNDDERFNDKVDYKKCPEPLDMHRAGGESCAGVDVRPDAKGVCHVGLYNPKLRLALKMSYPKKELPYFTNWQHFGMGEYVTGLEPGTVPPLDPKRRAVKIAPGRSISYFLRLRILTQKPDIDKFLKASGE